MLSAKLHLRLNSVFTSALGGGKWSVQAPAASSQEITSVPLIRKQGRHQVCFGLFGEQQNAFTLTGPDPRTLQTVI
jgi:hypothetical protein